MIVSIHLNNGVTSNIHFNDEEHKDWWSGLYMDKLAEIRYEEFPKELNAAVDLMEDGRLNLD